MRRRIIRSFEIGDKAFGWTVLLLFVGFLIHKPMMLLLDDLTTPQPWFTVAFTVPDHAPGDDPIVQYERTINRPVQGLRSARISKRDKASVYRFVCSGSGYAYYQPETSGPISVPLSAFVGSRCSLAPGSYRACAAYDLTDSRASRRTFGPFCDTFEVGAAPAR